MLPFHVSHISILSTCLIRVIGAGDTCRNISVNCEHCNDTMCKECPNGYYGPYCNKKCIGHCSWGCDIHTGRCLSCADGYNGINCSVKCSRHCSAIGDRQPTCDRSTGACSDGCSQGFCRPKKQCRVKCSKACLNNTCDFITCACMACPVGFNGVHCEKAGTNQTRIIERPEYTNNANVSLGFGWLYCLVFHTFWVIVCFMINHCMKKEGMPLNIFLTTARDIFLARIGHLNQTDNENGTAPRQKPHWCCYISWCACLVIFLVSYVCIIYWLTSHS